MSILARRRRVSLPDDPRLRVERWLSQRGVPQIISGYSTEQQIDRRSLPLILVWVAIGAVILRVGRSDGLTPGLVGDILATLVLTSLVLAVYARLRRHFPFGPFRPLGFLDVMVLALTPGAVTALLTRDILALPGLVPLGDTGVNVSVAGLILLGHGVIFAVMALGLPELAMWGGRHLRSQLVPIATLVARTLPLLLILVVFLMFASELWQTARALGWGDVIAILLLLSVVGGGLVVVRASEEIRSAQGRVFQLATIERLLDTPAAELLADEPDLATDQPLRRLERTNLVVLVLVSQLVQAVFVAGMVMVFLVLLGLLAVPAGVQATWIGEPARELLTFGLLGEVRLLSVELVIASALLAAMCGLYFTGLALTDSAYRIEFESRVVREVEKIVGVRAVYLAHIGREAAQAEL